MSERVDAWLAAACADAVRRGLPELKPLLEGLARSTEALRIADAELDERVPRTTQGRSEPEEDGKPGRHEP
jgi:hypothetical protein